MVSAKEIRNFLGIGGISGNPERVTLKISKIIPGEHNSLSFCKYEEEKAVHLIKKSRSSVIICSSLMINLFFDNKTLILVPRPRLAFMKAANEFFPWRDTPEIHPTAVISNAKIGKNVRIGANTVVGGEGF
ncbi:MAG: hypothetical protein V1720_17555, partial [bacterium]